MVVVLVVAVVIAMAVGVVMVVVVSVFVGTVVVLNDMGTYSADFDEFKTFLDFPNFLLIYHILLRV